MPEQGVRERVYGRYVSAGQAVAPTTAEGLRPRQPALEQLIARHFPRERDAAILDLGCGGGALLYFAQRAGYRNARGVDGSAEQAISALLDQSDTRLSDRELDRLAKLIEQARRSGA